MARHIAIFWKDWGLNCFGGSCGFGTERLSRGLALVVVGLALAMAGVSVAGAQVIVNKAEDPQIDDGYHSEFNYGVNFNTNAGYIGGGMLKYVVDVNPTTWHGLYAELAHVKNPKEERVTNTITNNSFILFKQNYFIPLRLAYVRENLLFRKAPEDGVQLNWVNAGGVTLGWLKPYYVLYSPDNNVNNAQSVPYNSAIHGNNPNTVLGAGSFFDGFNDMKMLPGVHLRSALSFEFGTSQASVVGAEIGALVEQYGQQVPIMDRAPNRSFFTSLYLTFYYGSKK